MPISRHSINNNMYRLKIFIPLLLAVTLIFSAAACSKNPSDETTHETGEQTTSGNYQDDTTGEEIPPTVDSDSDSDTESAETTSDPSESSGNETENPSDETTAPEKPADSSSGMDTAPPPTETSENPKTPATPTEKFWAEKQEKSVCSYPKAPNAEALEITAGTVYYARITTRDSFNTIALPVSAGKNAEGIISIYRYNSSALATIAQEPVFTQRISVLGNSCEIRLGENLSSGAYYLKFEGAGGSFSLYTAATTAGSLLYNQQHKSLGKKLAISASLSQTFYYGEGNVLYQLTESSSVQMMSYIIKTKQDRYIVIDGGMPADGASLYEFLNTVCRGKIEIAAWIFTHGHDDHLGAFVDMTNKHFGEFKVNAFYHALIDAEAAAQYEPSYHSFIQEVNTALSKYNANTIHVVSTGDKITIDDVNIEFLRGKNTPYAQNAINNSSIVFKAVLDGQTVLFTGDLGNEGAAEVLAQYRQGELRADFVQMAHHGQNGAPESFYQSVQPKACLWSTPLWLWDNNSGGGYNSGPWKTLETRAWMEKLGVKTHFISYRQTNAIVFPYSFSA